MTLHMPAFIRQHWATLAIVAITLAAFCIRFYHLDWQCLNVDEVVTQSAARQSAEWIVSWSLDHDYNPPLYYLCAHYAVAIFGDSIFAVRLPAVIFGTLTIPAIYLIGKQVKDEMLGVLAASVSTIMFPLFYYSQDARAYSLVTFAFMGFVYFFIRIYRGERERALCAGLAICAAICFYSHFYSLVPITILGLILLKRDWLSTLQSLFIVVILCIPEALLFNPAQFTTRTAPQIFNVFWATPEQMATMLPNELLCWAVIIVVPMMIWSLWRCRQPLLKIFFFTGLVTAVLLIPLAKLTGLSPRYALLISPLFLIVALYPVAAEISRQPLMGRKIALFLLVVFLFFVFNYGSLLSWNTFNVCPYTNPGDYVS
jgi:mannosyltransferase